MHALRFGAPEAPGRRRRGLPRRRRDERLWRADSPPALFSPAGMRASKIAACAALALLLGIAAVHAAEYSEWTGAWGARSTQPPQQPPVAPLLNCTVLRQRDWLPMSPFVSLGWVATACRLPLHLHRQAGLPVRLQQAPRRHGQRRCAPGGWVGRWVPLHGWVPAAEAGASGAAGLCYMGSQP